MPFHLDKFDRINEGEARAWAAIRSANQLADRIGETIEVLQMPDGYWYGNPGGFPRIPGARHLTVAKPRTPKGTPSRELGS